MRLLYDVFLGKPYEVQEIKRIEMVLEIYYDEGGNAYDIDIRDENDSDDIYYKIDSTKYDYFPDEVQAKFFEDDNRYVSCYMHVGRSKEKFNEVIDEFSKLLERIAETGFCKQSDFSFTECTWE